MIMMIMIVIIIVTITRAIITTVITSMCSLSSEREAIELLTSGCDGRCADHLRGALNPKPENPKLSTLKP